MSKAFTVEQLEAICPMFVEVCRRGLEAGLSPRLLAVALQAMAERLVDDNSPLERYVNNPNGDNPENWSV